MTGITRKPAFWIAFALAAAIALVVAWQLFPRAIPLINLDVKMSRAQALAAASTLAGKLGLAPPDSQRAVLFTSDGATQNFVELEAGGKAAFTALLEGTLYAPYRWEVRLFNPGRVDEAQLSFRPDGAPYGFSRKVPESEPGPALQATAARAIAEERARLDWGIDFAPYKLLEQSQVQLPNKRIDHLFVYEREHETLGDGRFRLRLVVSGDRLTELTHFVFVPEAFQRRYQELRSTNNNIARVASLAAGALYGIGGCIFGVLWLLRKRRLLWKSALVAGVIVAGLNALALLANVPSAWFGYDTAQTTGVFWGQQIGLAILILFGGGLALALVFMAAESLARLSFPNHPQLWRIWSRDAAPTPAILGRTLGGYLFMPIELALIAVFYYVTNRYMGWWQPSESLTDPNILGSALPALGPIAMALQAGFMEECLFRAVPLSIAALLGARFGRRAAWIAGALVVQALVFGSAHANYPGFPAYSRPVELFVPAFIWGLIFLRFGLLPTVILHALFDLTLMSIPVFLVGGPGSMLNQVLVIAAALVPLAVVLARRAAAGRWLELSGTLRNGGWLAPAAAEVSAAARGSAAAGVWTARVQRVLPALGVAGLAAIVLGGDFHSDAPPIRNDRAAAEAAADAALKERGVELGPDWHRFSVTRLASTEEGSWLWHKFVWREAGADVYDKLVGTWLAPPVWQVRYARFSGADVADRAEEWRVAVAGDGKVRQVLHRFPERLAGAQLSREEAALLAQKEIQERFGLDPAVLREVSGEQTQRPSRRDWEFTYTDPRVDVGKDGETRVFASIAGDRIANSGRYVFVPEQWQRAESDRAGRMEIVRMGVSLITALIAIAALVAAILAWTRDQFDRRAFAWVASLLFLLTIASAINQWPMIAMRLQTTEPVTTQIAFAVARTLLVGVLGAMLGGLLAGVAAFAARAHVEPGRGATSLWLRGAAAALLVIGVDTLIGAFTPDLMPTWPAYDAESAWLPWLGRVFGSGNSVTLMAATIVAFYWLDRLTSGWTRRRLLAVFVLVLAEAAIAALKADQWLDVVAAGLIGGAVSTLLFATVLRFDLRALPAMVAVYVTVSQVGDAVLKGTPQAALLAAAGVTATLVLAWAATRYLLGRGPGWSDAAGADAAQVGGVVTALSPKTE